ncbi:MAG: PD-(D/E)XK nuclease family protein [Patescibacteria group bacterium]|jgi:RecB family exonuclease|nr:PD-(D/E)XK nuclease family protein [Patescibacteria group bacterium]
MHTSFSALDTFRTCPLKYKFQQIDKIRTPKGPEAVFGSLIHDTMKFIHDGNFLLPTEKDALNHFSSKWNPDVFEDEIQERSAFAQGIKIIQDYYKKNNPNDAQIVDLESRFSVEIKDGKNSHIISGFIDRIDKTEKGFEIIDYKTARKLPPQETVETSMQLLIYLLAFLKRYPQFAKKTQNVELSLHFLKHGTKLTASKTPQQVEEEKEAILEIIHEIEKSDFPAQVTPLCDWCGYQKMCPMWKHKFKEEPIAPNEEEKKQIIEEYLVLQDKIKGEKRRVAELQVQILEIMENEEVERLFAEGKIIAKTSRKTWKHDEEKLKSILEEIGAWEKVLKLDGVKLRQVTGTLPPSIKKSIEKTKYLDKESFSVSVKKDKGDS